MKRAVWHIDQGVGNRPKAIGHKTPGYLSSHRELNGSKNHNGQNNKSDGADEYPRRKFALFADSFAVNHVTYQNIVNGVPGL